MIGDRFDYVIDVEKDLVQVVDFPVFEPRDGKIELVESCPWIRSNRDRKAPQTPQALPPWPPSTTGKYNLGVAQVLYADKNILDTLHSRDSLYSSKSPPSRSTPPHSRSTTSRPRRRCPSSSARSRDTSPGGFSHCCSSPPQPTDSTAGWPNAERVSETSSSPPRPCLRTSQPSRPLETLHNQKLWQNNRHKHNTIRG